MMRNEKGSGEVGETLRAPGTREKAGDSAAATERSPEPGTGRQARAGLAPFRVLVSVALALPAPPR